MTTMIRLPLFILYFVVSVEAYQKLKSHDNCQNIYIKPTTQMFMTTTTKPPTTTTTPKLVTYQKLKSHDNCQNIYVKPTTKMFMTTTTKATTTTTPTTTEPTNSQPSTTTELMTTIPPRLECPNSNWTLFERTPTANNSLTSHWCLQLIIRDEEERSTASLKTMCAEVGGVVSLFENKNESRVIFGTAATVLPDERFFFFSVDGIRKAECFPEEGETGNGNCTDKTKMFYVEDNHTDPTYLFNSWATGEPSGLKSELEEGKFVISSCAAVYYIGGVDYDDDDDDRSGLFGQVGKYKDFACDEDTPRDYYMQLNGVVCGTAPSLV